MKRNAVPCWITEDGRHIRLERIPLGGHEFPEEFLQEILHQSPELIPVDEFDGSFGPLVSLGREIDGIDNLFIAPSGYLTLVETKLWRNPESAREVVAQVLDYASRLAGMSFPDFEALCRKAMSPAPIGARSLFEFVSNKYPELTPTEAEFIDLVSRSLRIGRFLLLIVGDGIREGLENILAVLHTHPQMHFTFGLVNLQVHQHPEAPAGRLIIPQVVANTVEIVRATVRVETSGVANVVVEFEPPAEGGPGAARRKKLSEEEFLSNLPDDRTRQMAERILGWCDEKNAVLEWGASSVSVRLQDPKGSRQMFTLFLLRNTGAIYTGWFFGQLEKAGYGLEEARTYISRLTALFPGVKVKPEYPDTLSQDIAAELVAGRLDDLLEVTSDFIDTIRERATQSSNNSFKQTPI